MKTAFNPSRNVLAGLVALESKVSLYLPSTIHDQPAAQKIVNYNREKVSESFSRWFGGYTETQGHGGWYSEQLGKLIREPVIIISASLTPQALERQLAKIVALAQEVAQAMEQECVALDVDGVLYFVPAPVAVAV